MISKVKTLVLVNKNIFFVQGAYSNRFRGLFEGLAKRDIEIHILICHGYWNWKEFLHHRRYNYPENIFIYYVGYPYQLRVLKRIKSYLSLNNLVIKKQKSLQKETKFNYGCINSGLTQDFYKESILLFKQDNAKIIQEMNEHPSLFLFNIEYEKYLKEICPEIDIMILMTNGLVKFYDKYLSKNSKSYHLPMTVDFERFNINRTKDLQNDQIITYVGFMDNKKDGVDLLVKAFANVVKQYPNAKLKLIGPKEPKDDYLKQLEIIKNHKITNNVQYLGRVSRDKIPELLINSDCLVLARPDSKQAQFGFPTKLGEYLATGNPVVVTSTGEITNYLKDNYSAFIASPGNIKDISDKILQVLSDKNNSYSVGQKGFEIAMKYFNSEVQANGISEILKENL